MKPEELAAAERLYLNVTFLPGSYDKRFTRDMQAYKEKDISEKQREFLIKLFHKYRRQIPDYETVKKKYNL